MRIQVTEPKQAEAIAKILKVDWTEGMAFTITAPKNVVGRPCECGCGQKTSGGLWVPGHDAKHKSRLYQLVRGTDVQQSEAAKAELDQRGWPQPAKVRTVEPLPLATNAS